MQKLDFPEFVSNNKDFQSKLMDVAHVLVCITPPGTVVFGGFELRFWLFGFLENITNSGLGGRFPKNRNFKNWDGGLRMARIEASRGGGIEGALAEPVWIQEKIKYTKRVQKLPIYRPGGHYVSIMWAPAVHIRSFCRQVTLWHPVQVQGAVQACSSTWWQSAIPES